MTAAAGAGDRRQRSGAAPGRVWRDVDLPPAICFRITRYCNARCGFCLAPPDGAHPDADTLMHRIDWLVEHGAKTIHFCGGEPTIHPALPLLISHARRRGAKTKLTTNGIAISEEAVAALRRAGTRVKVSLHGDREHHDRIVGRQAFDRTTRNLAGSSPRVFTPRSKPRGCRPRLGSRLGRRVLSRDQSATAEHPDLHPARQRQGSSSQVRIERHRALGSPRNHQPEKAGAQWAIGHVLARLHYATRSGRRG